jgi:mannose-6-phosphate isomerase
LSLTSIERRRAGNDVKAVYPLTSVIQHYAWGSKEIIPELLGTEPDGRPVAELWMGVNPGGPSALAGESRTLAELIASDPVGMLGAAVAHRFSGLPYLLKVLAIEHPLSLQAHPSLEQAVRGFDSERGLAMDLPTRNYRDSNHKPEQVCALTDFEGLCGFRPVEQSAHLLQTLGTPALLGYRTRLLGEGGLRDVVTDLLTAPTSRIAAVLAEVRPEAERVSQGDGPWSAEAGWLVRLGSEYPGDRGVVIAALLNLVQLSPGQSMFLPAGELHAYLHGVGVELMANSDNVLRGGLTPKHVDAAELLSILKLTADRTVPTEPTDAGAAHEYPSSVPDFRLSSYALTPDWVPVGAGSPSILLCVRGTAWVDDVELARGTAAFIPASAQVKLRSTDAALVFRATTNM